MREKNTLTVMEDFFKSQESKIIPKLCDSELSKAEKILEHILSPAYFNSDKTLESEKFSIVLGIPYLSYRYLFSDCSKNISKVQKHVEETLKDKAKKGEQRQTSSSSYLLALPNYGRLIIHLLLGELNEYLFFIEFQNPAKARVRQVDSVSAYHQALNILRHPDTKIASLPPVLKPLLLSEAQIEERIDCVMACHVLSEFLWYKKEDSSFFRHLRESKNWDSPQSVLHGHLKNRIDEYLSFQPRLKKLPEVLTKAWHDCLLEQFLSYITVGVNQTKKNLKNFEALFEIITPLAVQWVTQKNYSTLEKLVKIFREKNNGFSSRDKFGEQKISLDDLFFASQGTEWEGQLISDKKKPAMDSRRHHVETITQAREVLLTSKASRHLEAQMVYTQAIVQQLNELIQEVVDLVSVVWKPPCAFSVLGVGSIARGSMCPGSDLDLALLIEKEIEIKKEKESTPPPPNFFKQLVHTLQLRLNTLGIPGLEIDRTDISQMFGEEIQVRMINTPEKLCAIPESLWKNRKTQNTTEFLLYYSLLRPIELYSSPDQKELPPSKTLWARYGEARKAVLAKPCQPEEEKTESEPLPLETYLGSQYLSQHQQDWKKSLQTKKADSVSQIDLKKDYLQPLLFWCLDLALIFQLRDESGEPTTAFNTLLHQLREHVSPAFMDRVASALDFLHGLLIAHHPRFHQEIWRHGLKQSNCFYAEAKAVPEYASKDLALNETQRQRLQEIEEWLLKPAYASLKITRPLNPLDRAREWTLRELSSGDTSQRLEQLRWLAELMQHRSAELPNPEYYEGRDPHFLKENMTLCHHWRCYWSLSRQDRLDYLTHLSELKADTSILEPLHHTPESSGWRATSVFHQQDWQAALSDLIEGEPCADLSPEAKKSIETGQAVWLQWVVDEKIRWGHLKPAYQSQLLDEKGLWKPKPNSQGNHRVYPLEDKEKKLRFWLKLYPELPGTEYLVQQLDRRLGIFGTPSHQLMAVHHRASTPGKGMVSAALVTPHVGDSKSTLSHIAKNRPELLKKIDFLSFIQTLFRVLLTNPEDDKGNDYFLLPIPDTDRYRLVRIDNERAFFAVERSKKSWFSTHQELQVKSMLYCLDIMNQTWDNIQDEDQRKQLTDFLEDLKRLNAIDMLKEMFQDVEKLHPLWQQLFPEEVLKAHAVCQDPWMSLPVFMIPQGIEIELLKRFQVLQSALLLHKPEEITGLELLKLVQPKLATHYGKWFGLPQSPSARARFEAVAGSYYQKDAKGEHQTASSASFMLSAQLALTLPLPDLSTLKHQREQQKAQQDLIDFTLGIASQKHHSVQQAMKTVNQWEIVNIPQIAQRLLKKSSDDSGVLIDTQELARLSFQLLSNRQKNQVLAFLFKTEKITEEQQRVLSTLLVGSGMHEFNARHFAQVLTDDLLLPILQQSEERIVALDLSHCQRLTPSILTAIAKHCPHLKTLRLRGLPWTEVYVTQLPQLKRLDFSQSALTRLNLNALPQLKTLKLQQCQHLTQVKQAKRLLTIERDPAEPLPKLERLDISGCQALSDLGLVTDTSPQQSEIKDNPRRLINNLQYLYQQRRLQQKDEGKLLLLNQMHQAITQENGVLKLNGTTKKFSDEELEYLCFLLTLDLPITEWVMDNEVKEVFLDAQDESQWQAVYMKRYYNMLVLGDDSNTEKTQLLKYFVEKKIFKTIISMMGKSYGCQFNIVDIKELQNRHYLEVRYAPKRLEPVFALICFTIFDLESFLVAKSEVEELRYKFPNCLIALVETQLDRVNEYPDERQIDTENILYYVLEHDLLYLKCSTKTGQGIYQIFQEVGEKLIKVKEPLKSKTKATRIFLLSNFINALEKNHRLTSIKVNDKAVENYVITRLLERNRALRKSKLPSKTQTELSLISTSTPSSTTTTVSTSVTTTPVRASSTATMTSSSIPMPRELFSKKSLSERKIPSRQPLNTQGGGDCAFHAVLGQWDEKRATVACSDGDVIAQRKRLAQAIRAADKKSPLSPLIQGNIRELVISGQGKGKQFLALQQRYQEFLEDQKTTQPQLWQNFAASLREHPSVMAFILPQEKSSQNDSQLRTAFYDALNREEGVLYGLILSLPALQGAFETYNACHDVAFDWESAITPDLIKEYSELMEQPHNWLLPSEIQMLAHVFDLTVEYYPHPQATQPAYFNPGKTKRVAVQFNGRDHFEQLPIRYVTSTLSTTPAFFSSLSEASSLEKDKPQVQTPRQSDSLSPSECQGEALSLSLLSPDSPATSPWEPKK